MVPFLQYQNWIFIGVGTLALLSIVWVLHSGEITYGYRQRWGSAHAMTVSRFENPILIAILLVLRIGFGAAFLVFGAYSLMT